MTEITDQQRKALEHMDLLAQMGANPDSWSALRNLLPPELTNPQPVLPTEAGAYHDARGILTMIDPKGRWHGKYGDFINPDLCPGPFTRLVPERPQITREQVKHAGGQTRIGELTDWQVDRILALVNGADRD